MDADKAYDSGCIRSDLELRGVKPVLPPRSKRKNATPYDIEHYHQRNCIECAFRHLKTNCSIAARYGQLPDIFLSKLHTASARY